MATIMIFILMNLNVLYNSYNIADYFMSLSIRESLYMYVVIIITFYRSIV